MKMFNKSSKHIKEHKKLTLGGKILITIGIVLSLGVIAIGAINIHFNNVDEKFAEKYSKAEMRFDIYLDDKEYKFLDKKKNNFEFEDKGGNIKNDFTTNSEVIQGKKQHVKYSEYVVTKDGQYVLTEIGGVKGWLKWDITMKNDSKEYIKSFLQSDAKVSCVRVYPFNDGNFVLINNGLDEHILDLNGKNITWTRGNNYDYPSVNVLDDTLICNKPSGALSYVFNKHGKLISQESNTKNK